MATQTSQDKVLTQQAAKINAHLAELFNLVEYVDFDMSKLQIDKNTLRGYFDGFEKKYTRIYRKMMKFTY